MSHKITMYTDGAASGNPGPGGYGVVLISGKHRKELSAGYKCTTNNRMELLAVIAGLEALKTDGCDVTVYTDSKYVSDAVNKGWLKQWQVKRFKGKKNPDLWQRYLRICDKHNIRFVWVKGHANIAGNERCDQLAVEASKKPGLLTDEGYENAVGSMPGGFQPGCKDVQGEFADEKRDGNLT